MQGLFPLSEGDLPMEIPTRVLSTLDPTYAAGGFAPCTPTRGLSPLDPPYAIELKIFLFLDSARIGYAVRYFLIPHEMGMQYGKKQSLPVIPS